MQRPASCGDRQRRHHAVGNDVPSFWSAIKQGRSGIGPLEHIDGEESFGGDLEIKIACEVKDFDAQARFTNRLMQTSDRYVQFAGAAAAEALAQSQLELPLAEYIGSSAAAHVGIEYGITGPTFGTVSACATATHAIGLPFGFISAGWSTLASPEPPNLPSATGR